MQVYRPARKFEEFIYKVPSDNKIIISPENNWKKLDDGLTKIENEWKERMMIEQYNKEFIKQSHRIIEDVDEFTVEELKCWYRLLNTKFKDKYKNGGLYFKNLDSFYYSEIHITYWQWTYNDIKCILTDIYFSIENELNDNIDECGAMFLNNEVVLINSSKCLYKTDNTSIELKKRIDFLKSIR